MLICGVDIKDNKEIFISLTAIYGIGVYTAKKICKEVNVDFTTQTKNLSDNQIAAISNVAKSYKIESELSNQILMDCKRLVDIRCYRGVRRRMSLPVRGQNTQSNAKTAKCLLKSKRF